MADGFSSGAGSCRAANKIKEVGGRWGKNRIQDSGFRSQEAEGPRTGYREQREQSKF
jgi:hypothetical protein